MNRIQHIKVVTDAPEELRTFLREVAELPDSFDIQAYGTDPPGNVQTRAKVVLRGPELTWDDIASTRGRSGEPGFVSGSVETRQLQVFPGEVPGIWAIAIGTRDLEGVHHKCTTRGIPTTPIELTPFVGSNVRAFFVIVGGITFEFLRVEPLDGNAAPLQTPP
jgi:hypothetical protein